MGATDKKHIGIVGAGVSGLQAARTILTSPDAHKFHVTIFEARNRIGGRVDTERKWGYPLDYGANFIHGTEGNPLAEIAERVGSTYVDSLNIRKYYDAHGKCIDQDTCALIYKKVWEYSDAAADYSRQCEDVDPKLSMEDFCIGRLESDKEVHKKDKHYVKSGIEMLAGVAACNLKKVSLKYYWMEDDLPGERPFLDSSYDPIVQYIAKPSLSKDLIKFNTQISSISTDFSKPHKAITLTTTSGEFYGFDSVIVTIPLGCLQRSTIDFQPSLPPSVRWAIHNLGYGTLEKLFVRFSEAWWLQPVPESERIGLEFYRFMTLISATHEKMPKGSLNFFSLARIHTPHPVFGIFVSTELGKFMVSQTKEKLKQILEEYYIPHLPNYDASNPACKILEVDSSAWSQDPLSGYGSYTHIPVGSESGDKNMGILSDKITRHWNGAIWFAGEHTANTELHGGKQYTTMATVTGAYKSGERAGNRVLEEYSRSR